jgi:hypothetical protein
MVTVSYNEAMEKMSYGWGEWWCSRLPFSTFGSVHLQHPLAHIRKPKACLDSKGHQVVIGTNIHVKRMASWL